MSDGFEEDIEPPDNGPWYISFCNWMGTLYERFEGSFITFFIVANLNHGFFVCVLISVKDYFKTYCHLDPGEQSIYVSMISLPWTFKLLYGLISDNVPVCGTRRKSWLIIMGFTQFFFLFIAWWSSSTNPLVITILLAGANLSEAFTNVVADAIMVIQARRDKAFGS